mmetsp:Transcript_14237/g.29212  ORF Transcript_14237/g.29212 Transcript_14237/m.29212 type:complete len:81 (-) Transcript_14237:1528-1770(-)
MARVLVAVAGVAYLPRRGRSLGGGVPFGGATTTPATGDLLSASILRPTVAVFAFVGCCWEEKQAGRGGEGLRREPRGRAG